MIKCVVFDLDGTLLDTLDTILYYLNKTFAENGVDTITRDECRRFLGKGARNLLERALRSRNAYSKELFDKIFTEYNAAYNAEPYYLTRPYDGVFEVIDALRARGVKLGILSNKPDFATRGVAHHFFGDAFDLVRGGIDGVALKPMPDAAFAMLDELGVSSNETAYVGDSDVDVLTAENFSPALFVSVLWGFREREELFDLGARNFAENADELIKYLI